MKKFSTVQTMVIGLALTMIMFASCASIPEKIGKDGTLAIGEFQLSASGYDKIDINDNIQIYAEITVQDTLFGKTYTTTTNKNGFYSFANLPPSHSFKIIQIKIRSQNGGAVWVNNPGFKKFTPLFERVINLGNIKLSFDGTKNYVSWQFLDLDSVEVDFKKMNLKTQWYSQQVVPSPLL